MADVLNHCAKYGYLQQVKELVEAGADVNKKSGEERGSALYFAACYGHVEICQLLLDNGADVNSPVKWGSTALHAVCDRGHGQVLNLLLSSNPDVNYQNNNGDTCLHVAAYRGYLELTRKLVEAGAEVRLRNRKGKTAQEEADARGHLQVAKYLAEVALRLPIKCRPKPEVRAGVYVNRLKGFLPSSTRRHSIFLSAPESSMNTGNSLKTSDLTTTDWTVDSNASLTSVPETCQSDSFIPNIPASVHFNSLPCDIPNGSESNNSFYASVSQSSDSFYTENGFDGVFTRRECDVKMLQKELEREREKSNQLEKTVSMIPELRVMMQRMHQDNWALKKDVENLHKQLTVVAKQRDEAELALQAARGKQDVTDRRRAVQEYRDETNFGRSVSTVDADDFVICFEENNLNGDDQEGSTAAMLSKSGGYEQQQDKCDTAEFRNNMMTSSLPVKLNGDRSKTHTMITAAKKFHEVGGKVCTDRSQSDNARVKATCKSDGCSDMRGMPSGQTEVKYEDATPLKVRPGQSKHYPESDFSPLLKRRSLPMSSSSSSSAAVYRAMLNSFKDTPEEVLEKLGLSLTVELSAFQQGPPVFVADRTGREWILGKDFVLDQLAAGNIKKDRQTGICSLSLGICHKSHPLDLKIIFRASTDLSSSSSDIHLPALRQFPTEYDTLLQLVTHPNIMRICHYYHGTVGSLQQLLKMVVSQDFHLSTQGSNQSFCVVTERYPYTLQTLTDKMLSEVAKRSQQDCDTRYNGSMQDFIVIPPSSSFSTSSGQAVASPIVKETNCMPEDLLLLILYQLLSAVNHLLLHGVVHRDIKPDSIYLDRQLRVVLGNFGLARRLLTQDGQDIMYVTSDQITAGNPLSWSPELTRFKQDGVKCTSKEVSLRNVYSHVDCFSIGRMFYSLLLPQDNFPSPSPSKPHYRDDEIPHLPLCYSAGVRNILFELILDNPEDRLTCPVAMTRIGVMLFGPARDEVNSVKDCTIWRHARMMSLIRHAKSNKSGLISDSFTVQECIESVSPEVERHFVMESKGEDIWNAYRWLVSLEDAS